MDKNSSSYIFGFALIVCLICSFVLTFVSQGLKDKQQLNVVLDKKKNILKVVNLREPIAEKETPENIIKIYEEKIKEIAITVDGKIVEGEGGAFPLYIYQEGGQTVAYAFPVVGQGLWSTMYGYFSLEPDVKTVRGLTFYEHGETPGLGAEIEKEWFQSNFVGKKIWDSKAKMLKPVAVVKGKVVNVIKGEEEQRYYVDGISGATITSQGVTKMMVEELNKYEPYFKTIRK